jgi:hypothetical protein
MLRHLEGVVSDATFRFFAVKCARRVAHLVSDRRSLDALEVGESFARGIATAEQVSATREAAVRAADEALAAEKAAEELVFNALDAEVWNALAAVAFAAKAAAGAVAPNAAARALETASAAAYAIAVVGDELGETTLKIEEAAQCDMLRELVGWPPHSALW